MRQRRDMREAYQRVMPKTWEGFNSTDTNLIKSAIKGVWRKLTGKPCPYPLVVNNRVRHAWVHYQESKTKYFRNGSQLRTPGRYVFMFKPKEGVQSVIHSTAHFIHSKQHPSDTPHSDRHLEMERTAAEYVVKRFRQK